MRDLVQRQADGGEVAYRVRNKLVREGGLPHAHLGRPGARPAAGAHVVAGCRRTLPDYLSAPSSQTDQRAATGS